MNIDPLLALIRKYESDGAVRVQNVHSPYDVVWGGINRRDRPPRPLTQMTVQEVLDWQDSIDRAYMSEASGAYQIMEDTLRGMVVSGQIAAGARFDQDTQDAAAIALLNRRGLARYIRGELTDHQFADQIAREWASFPVTRPQKGQKRHVQVGETYYAGDGLNKAHAPVEDVLAAVRAIRVDAPRVATAARPAAPDTLPSHTSQGGGQVTANTPTLRIVARYIVGGAAGAAAMILTQKGLITDDMAATLAGLGENADLIALVAAFLGVGIERAYGDAKKSGGPT